jgi:acetyltransferase-like isoleucine patch superfamily enzyme
MKKLNKLFFLIFNFFSVIKYVFSDIVSYTTNLWLRIKWRKLNRHNFTEIKNYFPINKVKAGKYSYGDLNIHSWNTKEENLYIGNFVSIAKGVHFILGGNHNYKHFSSYPFKINILNNSCPEAETKGPIIIEDGVWIGANSIILSGVKIGAGAVIGAGSIVTKDIPPYSIAAGNPAKVVKFRFDEPLRNQLQGFEYEKIDKNFIQKNLQVLYQDLDEESLGNLNKSLNE